MHPNPAFRKIPDDQLLTFAKDRGFGTLTINGSDDTGPLMSHIPFVFNEDMSEIRCHLLKSNPILKRLDAPKNGLLSVSGPDSYISPDWYELDDQVPTWNYCAVHLRGELRALDRGELRDHLTALSYEFERRLAPKPVWKMDKVDSVALQRMQMAIAPVAFKISSVDGTWKLNQNKPAEARLKAAIAVRNAGLGMMVDQLAKLMEGTSGA